MAAWRTTGPLGYVDYPPGHQNFTVNFPAACITETRRLTILKPTTASPSGEALLAAWESQQNPSLSWL